MNLRISVAHLPLRKNPRRLGIAVFSVAIAALGIPRQASSMPGVQSFSSPRLGIAPYRNPQVHLNRSVYVIAATRSAPVFRDGDWERKTRALAAPDAVLFDAGSRPEIGPIKELFRTHGALTTEIVNVVGSVSVYQILSSDIPGTAAAARLIAIRRLRRAELS